ncbi:MAG: hypothetical protein ACI87Q_002755 [Pseudohongiellaceae bacterium]|jgi:hypothetical protein
MRSFININDKNLFQKREAEKDNQRSVLQKSISDGRAERIIAAMKPISAIGAPRFKAFS